MKNKIINIKLLKVIFIIVESRIDKNINVFINLIKSNGLFFILKNLVWYNINKMFINEFIMYILFIRKILKFLFLRKVW